MLDSRGTQAIDVNISIRQLQGFIRVARLGSFTRAAEQLHITQAGLSAMIRDLEALLGCRLFDRTTRSVSLTREGHDLLPSAERIVAEMASAVANIQASTAKARRILTVAVTPIVAAGLLPQVCRELMAVAPEVTIQVRDVPQPQIQRLVDSGEVDIGLAIYLKPAAGCEVKHLLDFRMMCIAPAGQLPKGRRRRSGFRDLAWRHLPSSPLIALPADSYIQQEIDAYLDAHGRAVEGRPVCNSMQTIIAMVAAGYGASVLPSMIVPQCPAAQFDLACMTEPSVPLPYYLIARKGRKLPDTVESFAQTFVRVATRLCGT